MIRSSEIPFSFLRTAGRTLAWGALCLGFVHAPARPLAEGLLLLAALGFVFSPREEGQATAFAPHPLALAAGAWLVFSMIHRPDAGGMAETLQYLGILAVAPVLYRLAGTGRRAFGAALTAGWLLSLAAAGWQYASGRPFVAVDGFCGSRALYGMLLASTAPLVFVSLARLPWRGRDWLPALLVLLAGPTILYLPALALFVAGGAAAAFLLPRAGRRRVLLALALLVLALLADLPRRGQREALVRGVAAVDAVGRPRRWVLEIRAAARALARRPLLGHGPGRYQSVVSAGRYRADLPATAENRVEAGTQPALLVLAVEGGLPPALAVMALLLLLGRAAWRGGGPREGGARAAAISAWLFLPAGLTAQWMVQGAGVIFAAVLAAAEEAAPGVAEGGNSRWRTLPRQAGLLLLLALGAALVLLLQRPPAHSVAAPVPVVLIEAEDAADLAPPFVRAKDPYAAASFALAVEEADPAALRDARPAVYRFVLPAAGTYTLWIRARWRDGCGNSVSLGVDGNAPRLVGNDGTYQAWHWVRGPDLSLGGGAHTLQLRPREGGACVDQIALTPATGAEIAPRTAADAGSRAHRPSALPAWNPPPGAAKPAFRVGIGGAYCVGVEPYLVTRGIPYARLLQAEMADAAALRRYPVLWLAGPQRHQPAVWRALRTYLEDGGVAVLEVWDHPGPWTPDREALLAGHIGNGPRGYRNLFVRGEGSPYFEGISDPVSAHPTIVYWASFALEGGAETETHGGVYAGKRRIGPALVKRRVGAGRLYLLPFPFGFASLRDQRDFDPLVRRLLDEAIAGRYAPLFDTLQWSREGKVYFADDFMRRSTEGVPWREESGRFELTGPRENDPLAFSWRAEEGAVAAAGDSSWSGYAIRVSVLAGEGRAGAWLTTRRGRRIGVMHDGGANRLLLVERRGGGVRALREAPAPAGGGWRRLSLLWREGAWEGWIDGRPGARVEAPDDGAAGVFGLFVSRGMAYFDDVRVRDTGRLVSGSDVAVGEEGSPRANPPFRSGLEPRGIYHPLWYLRPDVSGRGAVALPLPLFREAVLSVDGTPMGRLRAEEEPLVVLPAAGPRRSLEIVAPGWRDYTFGSRRTDWYATGVDWRQHPRWSCDPQWQFLGVDADERASLLWYRHPLRPPYAAYVIAAPAMRLAEKNREESRGLNLLIGGNGADLADGYRILVGGEEEEGVALLRREELLERNPRVGLPHGGLAVHHRWFLLKVLVESGRIRFWLEDKPALDVPLPEPVAGGWFGIWTRGNALRLARVTLSLSALSSHLGEEEGAKAGSSVE